MRRCFSFRGDRTSLLVPGAMGALWSRGTDSFQFFDRAFPGMGGWVRELIICKVAQDTELPRLEQCLL